MELFGTHWPPGTARPVESRGEMNTYPHQMRMHTSLTLETHKRHRPTGNFNSRLRKRRTCDMLLSTPDAMYQAES
jgi:hypothetical protein